MTLNDFIHQSSSLFCPGQKGLLAVSGGIDSAVLCHLMHSAGLPFAIAHCNFHLRPGDCDRDEAFVRQLAQRYGTEFYLAHFDTPAYARAEGLSIEDAARRLRYHFFKEVLQGLHQSEFAADPTPLSYIATAHHRDDASETFFINLLRGTGIAGLHGIRPRQGHLIRPLLPFSRADIEAYAAANSLEHVEDSTNASPIFLRNRIRHEVLPLLRSIQPTADEALQRTMRYLNDTETIYFQAIEDCRKRICLVEGDTIRIAIDAVAKLNPQRTLLFELLRSYGFTAHQVDDILASLSGQPGACFQSPSHRLLRDRQHLIITPHPTITPTTLQISHPQTLTLPQGTLSVEIVPQLPASCDANHAYFDSSRVQWPLTLRHWQEGDRFHPFGMKGTQLVSDLFTHRKLSLVEKESAWILVDARGTILWIVGLRAAHLPVTETTPHVLSCTFIPI